MDSLPQQPEPCLGGIGTHDKDGRCYSRIACGTFGYCRERIIGHRGPVGEAVREKWKIEATTRAKAEQDQYLAERESHRASGRN